MDVFDLIVGFFAGVGVLALALAAWEAISERLGGADAAGDDAALGLGLGFPEDEDTDDGEDTDAIAVAQAQASALDDDHNWWDMSPEALELEPRFEAAVRALSADTTPVSEVIDLSRHPDGWAASMALLALARRDDVPDDWAETAIRMLPRSSNCEDCFQLRAIARHATEPAIGRILGRRQGLHPRYVLEFVEANDLPVDSSERMSV